MDLNIIYSDNNIAVIEKPAGVPSQPDKTGDADLLAAVRERFEYAGLIHRLDRPVGGLMVFALDKKSEAILSKEMSGDGFIKTYYAVCCGIPKNDSGILEDLICQPLFQRERRMLRRLYWNIKLSIQYPMKSLVSLRCWK